MFKDEYLSIVLDEVARIREEYQLDPNTPICDYIFVILQKECILAEWPEDEQLDLDGLSTDKVVHGRLETVVYINSAKSKEKQNFCAAHELGHRHKLDRQLKDAFPDDILKDASITKYMTSNELKKYLKAMGFTEDDITLIEDMKKIESETIEMDEIKESENPEESDNLEEPENPES